MILQDRSAPFPTPERLNRAAFTLTRGGKSSLNGTTRGMKSGHLIVKKIFSEPMIDYIKIERATFFEEPILF